VTDEPEEVSKVGVEPTDVELVRAYRNGDTHAFEELHRRYVASIYRLVRRKLGDALLAEDIAQETFMKALRMMDRVDDSFNFGGWVHTVARNLCFDELRRRQRDLPARGSRPACAHGAAFRKRAGGHPAGLVTRRHQDRLRTGSRSRQS